MPIGSSGDMRYHKQCLKCCSCHTNLSGQSMYPAPNNEGLHCAKCSARSKGHECNGCKQLILDGSMLSVTLPGSGASSSSTGTGKQVVYHPSCFVCTTCNVSLQGAAFFLKSSSTTPTLICQSCSVTPMSSV